MTREEAIKELEIHETYRDFAISEEALNVAIEALSTEPCEDCISRDEVMKLSQHKPEYGDMIYAFDVSILPSVQPKPKWIPVSERLPEELKGVLVYCPTNDNIFCAYLEKGVWKIFSPIALEDIKEIVTAWMPLPEPYKAEREDKE